MEALPVHFREACDELDEVPQDLLDSRYTRWW
jgi:hypothetical protein